MPHLNLEPRPLFRGYHAEARYRAEPNPAYRGNPLIEALPPLRSTVEAAARITYRPPPPTAADRELPHSERIHRLAEGCQFKVPLHQDLALYAAVEARLRGGYAGRNPCAPGAWAAVDDRAAGRAVLAQAVVVRPRALTRLGVSGGGKSVATRAVLSQLPQTISHVAYAGRPFIATQIPWLLLDCPHNGSPRGLCVHFFAAVDDVLRGVPGRGDRADGGHELTLSKRYVTRAATTDDLLLGMSRVAGALHLGLLVLDEVQALREARDNGKPLLNFLLEMVNTMGVPIMLIGTYRAYPLLATQLRFARRSEADSFWERLPDSEVVTVGDRVVTQPGADWAIFTEVLWDYQYTRTPIPRSPGMLQQLYAESQGIPDVAVKLFALAQVRAIQIGEQGGPEIVSEQTITSVAESELRLIRPIIRALRDAPWNPELLARLDDVAMQPLPDLLGVFAAPEVAAPASPTAERASPVVGDPGPAPAQRAPAPDKQGVHIAPAELPSPPAPTTGVPPASPTTGSRAGGAPKSSRRRTRPASEDPASVLRAVAAAGQAAGKSAHESLTTAGLIGCLQLLALGASDMAPGRAMAQRHEVLAVGAPS
jgi:hypothetical protein